MAILDILKNSVMAFMTVIRDGWRLKNYKYSEKFQKNVFHF